MSQETSNIFAQLLAAAQMKPPLELFSVSDRGIPNHERVNIRVNSRVSLGDYFLHAGILLPNGQAVPIPNVSLWLGADIIDAGSWIIVYTGPGEARLTTQTKDTKEPIVVLHWHVPNTLFNNKSIVPVLIQINKNTVQIGKADSPQ